jgi:hypothetical protein
LSIVHTMVYDVDGSIGLYDIHHPTFKLKIRHKPIITCQQYTVHRTLNIVIFYDECMCVCVCDCVFVCVYVCLCMCGCVCV